MQTGLFKPHGSPAARIRCGASLAPRRSPGTEVAAVCRCTLFCSRYPPLLCLCLVLSASCAPGSTARTIRLEQLEAAGELPLRTLKRGLVRDPSALEPLLRPLGRRLSLLEVKTPAEWEVLSRAVPGLCKCPDLAHGAVIGLVARAGRPLDGQWPASMERIRVSQGAGLLTVRFEGGSFLPDGTSYVELAQVEGLEAVLVVDVGASRFFPRQAAHARDHEPGAPSQ